MLDQKRQVIKRVHNLRVVDEVPRSMADKTIVNLRSKFEDDEDQLTELWSAIDLDQIMDEASDPHHNHETPTLASDALAGQILPGEDSGQSDEQSSGHDQEDTEYPTEELSGEPQGHRRVNRLVAM